LGKFVFFTLCQPVGVFFPLAQVRRRRVLREKPVWSVVLAKQIDSGTDFATF
jgi:hypothetical protein